MKDDRESRKDDFVQRIDELAKGLQDIAVFQDSDEGCYPLASKYRRTLRNIARMITLDVIPVRPNPEPGPFIKEIEKGTPALQSPETQHIDMILEFL